MTADYVLVTTTTDGRTESQHLIDVIVEARLAACAHIEEVESTYWWEGAIQHEPEFRVEFKTTAALADELQAKILQEHNYDLPQVIVTPIIGGHQPYLEWITAETAPRT